MDPWRTERITITVPLRSVETAIEWLKLQSVSLHERAARTRDPETARQLRARADALDAHAEELRRAIHVSGRPISP